MHFEQSAILTVHSHVITRNPRISVSHDKHRTWFLHITNVQEEDKGRYMCQINTVTAKTQFGYLHVVGKCVYCNLFNRRHVLFPHAYRRCCDGSKHSFCKFIWKSISGLFSKNVSKTYVLEQTFSVCPCMSVRPHVCSSNKFNYVMVWDTMHSEFGHSDSHVNIISLYKYGKTRVKTE